MHQIAVQRQFPITNTHNNNRIFVIAVGIRTIKYILAYIRELVIV